MDRDSARPGRSMGRTTGITLISVALVANLVFFVVLLRREESLAPSARRLVVPGVSDTQGERSLERDDVTRRVDLLGELGVVLGEIRSSLARIEERLTQLHIEQGPKGGRLPASEVGFGADDLRALVADIDGLKSSLESQMVETRAMGQRVQTLAELKAENPETKWDDLQSIIDLWHQDEEEALEEMRLLSDVEVMRRFGSPTEVWGNEKGINWIYGEGVDPTGGYSTEVWLFFVDRYVTMLGVK